MNAIQKIILFAERPEDAPEIISGEIRIELVKLIYSDGTEKDTDESFEYSFFEKNSQSFNQMINQVAMKYGIDSSNVKFVRS